MTSLVGAGGDAHMYEPTPADAALLVGADLIVVNGLGFEGFIDRLITASDATAPVVVASTGVAVLQGTPHVHGDDHGDQDAHHDHDHNHADDEESGEAPDPHAFQAIPNALIYIDNIAEALCGLDAENCAAYQARQAQTHADWSALDAELRADLQAVAADGRTLIVPHNAFAYLGAAYGLTFEGLQGVSTESEPSAASLAAVLRDLRDDGAAAAFPVNGADSRLITQIASELSIPLGAPLFAENFSDASGPAADYEAMQRHNIGAIVGALANDAAD
ncbi:ABC transporter, periplasmic binding protein [Ketogulonicigenium robustum]|uniref:ABC transporter, periplasmic binding protein n=1 Tax=Ketogulonicigenium robustum TaxID=92947 RepID=A0A1W6NXX2_9RHOB|nr:ABC transporter, periplasmic binding protein [Ketogulonicigenium robustum]